MIFKYNPPRLGAFVLISIGLCFYVGCSQNEIVTAPHKKEPQAHTIKENQTTIEKPLFIAPSGEISLVQSYTAVIQNSPKLDQFRWRVRAEEAKRLQAGLRLNPELSLDIEDFGGSGNTSGIENTETTIMLQQPFELGGKRKKRRHLAELKVISSNWNFKIKRHEVLMHTAKSYITVMVNQKKVVAISENLNLAQKEYDIIKKQVRLGSTSPLDLANAEADYTKIKVELMKAQHHLESSKIILASTWGQQKHHIQSVEDTLVTQHGIPTKQEVLNKIAQSPWVGKWANELAISRAKIQFEKSIKAPNINLGVGAKQFNESNDVALAFSFSVPLKLFNRNQGNLLKAKYQLKEIHAKQKSLLNWLKAHLSVAYENIDASQAEVKAFEKSLIPVAKKAFEGTKKAYLNGKVNFISLLDAQRTYFNRKKEYIDALARYQRSILQINMITGLPLSSFEKLKLKN